MVVVVDVGVVVKAGGAVGPYIFSRHDGSKEDEDTDNVFFSACCRGGIFGKAADTEGSVEIVEFESVFLSACGSR